MEEIDREEAHVEAVGLLYKVLDFCEANDLSFDEVLDSARQSWMGN